MRIMRAYAELTAAPTRASEGAHARTLISCAESRAIIAQQFRPWSGRLLPPDEKERLGNFLWQRGYIDTTTAARGQIDDNAEFLNGLTDRTQIVWKARNGRTNHP
jgi:hypothetical protein